MRVSGPSRLLDLAGLKVDIFGAGSVGLTVVDGVSLSLSRGETLGIVGESGCGKSLTLRAIQGVLPDAAFVRDGSIAIDGEAVRVGSVPRGVAMVFQDSLGALNPVYTVGNQLTESIRDASGCPRREARMQSIELLNLVGLSEPAQRMKAYPHQLSGGMRQRVVIALALSQNPDILLADEPTTALDVTVQDQILLVLERMQRERGLGIVFVSHDIGVISQVADRIMVMYAGRIVESGPADAILNNPGHPYTAALLRAVPQFPDASGKRRFDVIKGNPPTMQDRSLGCAFASRCSFAQADCEAGPVGLTPRGDDHMVACLHPEMTGW